MTEAVTLITGGAGGIGAATARRLLAEGYRVAVTGRDEGRLARFAAEVDAGPALLTIAGQADVDASDSATLKEYGRLDGVVANAGFSTHDNFVDGDPDRWREMLLVNVLGPALLARAALPALKESGGRVVMIGSVAGIRYS